MDEGLIAVRYATAVFLLAKEKNLLPVIKEDMETILNVCNQSADFNRLLSSPVVKPSEKIAVIRRIFANNINALSMNFLELIIKNSRETFISLVCLDVLAYIRKEKNIKTAEITTAQPLEKTILQKAEKIIEKELGARVELAGKSNPSLIGGMVLRIDDRQYDASVKTHLKKLKQELLKAQV